MRRTLRKLVITLLAIILVSASPGTASFGAGSEPAVHFTFDTDFKDASGSMEGTPVGDVSISDEGYMGKCAVFNSGYLKVSNSSGFNLGEKYTIAFWVKLDPGTRDVDSVSIISKPGEDGGQAIWDVYGDPQIMELLQRYNNDMGTVDTQAAGYIDCDQKWTHLVFENDGGLMYAYVDGKLASTYDMSRDPSNEGEAIKTSTESILIGKGDASNLLSGKIDDLRIYDGILSAADVKVLADAGKGSHTIVLQLLNTKMIVDGKEKPIDPNGNSDVYPFSDKGRTLVPIRSVVEAMGGKVAWDANDRRADISLNGKTIKLWLEKTTAEVDGAQKTLDVPAKSVGGRTVIPLRFVTENLGAKVEWDGNTQKITIRY